MSGPKLNMVATRPFSTLPRGSQFYLRDASSENARRYVPQVAAIDFGIVGAQYLNRASRTNGLIKLTKVSDASAALNLGEFASWEVSIPDEAKVLFSILDLHTLPDLMLLALENPTPCSVLRIRLGEPDKSDANHDVSDTMASAGGVSGVESPTVAISTDSLGENSAGDPVTPVAVEGDSKSAEGSYLDEYMSGQFSCDFPTALTLMMKRNVSVRRNSWPDTSGVFLEKGSYDFHEGSNGPVGPCSIHSIDIGLFENGDHGTSTRLPEFRSFGVDALATAGRSAESWSQRGWTPTQEDMLAKNWVVFLKHCSEASRLSTADYATAT